MKIATQLSRPAIWDTLILAAVLTGLNVWTTPSDFGWLKANPSPYLALPLLIGGRFGFAAGVGAGLLATLVIVAGHVGVHHLGARAFLAGHKYLFTGLVLTGALAGEIHRLFRSKLARAEGLQEDFQHRLKQLDNELYFLREAKSELDLVVATRDTDLWTLDSEIRELYHRSLGEFYQKLLLILARHTHMSDAAIYTVQEQHLSRQALIGEAQLLPAELGAHEVEMVKLALERKTAVTIPEFWKREFSQHRNYLITLPILDFEERVISMLIVTGMPFFSLNQKTVHLITVICRWAAKVLETHASAAGRFRLVDGHQNQRVFSPEVLRQNIDLAYHSYQTHHLPSALALFWLPPVSTATQGSLERTVLPLVRAADCPAQLKSDRPNLAVLFPLTGERIALLQVNRILEACGRQAGSASPLEHRLLTFDHATDTDQLWQELQELAS